MDHEASSKIKDNRGFTLVEILVALAVLAIISIPLLSYFSDASRMNALSANKHKANLAAQAVMEDFKTKDMETIAMEYRGLSGKSGQYRNSSYDEAAKYLASEAFVAEQPNPANDPVTPYYFQYSNYMVGGTPYDIRVQVEEGQYQYTHVVSGTTISLWNTFQDYDIGSIESNTNVVIEEGVSDQNSAIEALYKECQDAGEYSVTKAMIQTNMKRTITLDFNKNAADNTVTVKCTFSYNCPGIAAIAAITKNVVRFEKTYTELKNVFLFYNPMTTSTLGNIKDQIKITTNIMQPGGVMTARIPEEYGIYIIGNIADTLRDTYVLGEICDPGEDFQLVKGAETTNPVKNSVNITSGYDTVHYIGSTDRGYTAEYFEKIPGHNQRLLNIHVEVYKAGCAGDLKYLIMTLNSAEDD